MTNITIDIKSVNNFSKAKRKTIAFIAQLGNKHDKVFPTQDKISKFADCSPEWVSKMTTELHNEGWLRKTYRHMTSCIYELSPFWFDFNNRQALKHIIPPLAWIPLSVGMLISSNLTKSSNDIYRNISYSSFEEITLEKVVSNVVEKVSGKYGMNSYQREQLSNFPDSVVSQADQIVSKSNPTDPVAYLFGICRKKVSNNTSSFKNNNTTEAVSDNASLKNNRQFTNQTTQPPMYSAYIPEVQSADYRKELMQKTQALHKKRDEHLAACYGQSRKEVKLQQGFVSLAQIIVETLPIASKLEVAIEDSEAGWWSQLQPMDIEDYDCI